MQYLKVKNWADFQHYKDRNPPWIKLHRTLLTDYDFACLHDASKLHLMLIWLLASQTNNQIPADADYLKNVLNLDQAPDLKELIDKGFLEGDSNTLARCKQSAIVETETETETETEKQEPQKRKTLVRDDWQPSKQTQAWFADQGFAFSLEDMRQRYIDGCHSKQLKYVDHDRTIKNWSRDRHDRSQKSGGNSRTTAAERNEQLHNYLDAKIAGNT